MRVWFWAFGAALFAIRFTTTSLSIFEAGEFIFSHPEGFLSRPVCGAPSTCWITVLARAKELAAGSRSWTKNQARSLVSHCTSSPTRERRGRH
jgi:hypothetical protein